MLVGELEASETISTVPVFVPVPLGEKVHVKVTLFPGLSVSGNARPLMEKVASVTLACEIVTESPPVLASVSDNPSLFPT